MLDAGAESSLAEGHVHEGAQQVFAASDKNWLQRRRELTLQSCE